MLSKRRAAMMLLMGIVAKMAHADEKGNIPQFPTLGAVGSTDNIQSLVSRPAGITINLDSFTGITAWFGGASVTLTPEQIFKALTND